MKKQYLLLLCLSAYVIVLTGCNKETPTPVEQIKDIDGNIYHSVTIGTQVWMVENLKVTHYRNGDPIPHVIDNTAWSSLNTGAYRNYDNDGAHADTIGRLYNWYAVAEGPLLAPEGWHIPSDAELTVLNDYLGGKTVAGGKLKETGTAHWATPNDGATNETGFTALPGGYCNNIGQFNAMGNYCYLWSSTESTNEYAYIRTMWWNGFNFSRITALKNYGMPVRCIKD